jgi:multidrug resistance efflux pump
MKKLDIRELQAELKQAEFDIARKARTIIALNESYKALRDGLEPKLADITGKRNAAESRATEAERQLKQAQEASEDGVAHWTAKCNEIETLLSEKLTAAESRAEQAELSEESMYEKVRSLAPHGT